jgi:hypothetical protein
MSGKRNYHTIEADEGDGNHWIRLGETASAKLLMRLVKYHSKKTAPAAKQRPLSRDGSGERTHGPESNVSTGSIPVVSTTSSTRAVLHPARRSHRHERQ